MVESNPYESPVDVAAEEPEPWSLLRTVLYLLAAIPAGFLPLGYFAVIGCVFAEIVFGYDLLPPQPGSPMAWLGEWSIQTTFIQWPFYALWVLLSRELGNRAKAAWIGILFMLNMFAIPLFLYCKYRRQVWPILQRKPKSKQVISE
jgi:hypothetical protein